MVMGKARLMLCSTKEEEAGENHLRHQEASRSLCQRGISAGSEHPIPGVGDG